MSKIKKKTSLFVKFLYGSVFFALAGYVASAVPALFSKDYTNSAPKLINNVQADVAVADGFSSDGVADLYVDLDGGAAPDCGQGH